MSHNYIMGHQGLVKMTNTKVQREDVIDNQEFQGMIARCNELKYPHEYYRLRDLAIICIFRKTGKRRIEVARLKRTNIEVKDNYIHIVFFVAKKRTNNKLLRRREKLIQLSDSLAQPILDYVNWFKQNEPEGEYLFPHTTFSPFGNLLIFDHKKPTDGRTLLRTVKKLNPNAWAHLFRESAAADIVRGDPSIMAVFKVQKRLDLESYLTAFRYITRFATDIIESDQEIDTLEKV